MKNSKFNIVKAGFLTILVTFTLNLSFAQQNAQWPFYIAFEDATGAKDTLWMVYDTGTSDYYYGIEPELGEIPLDSNNTNEFRIWIHLDSEGNQYNTIAVNISFPFLETEIYAENYILPITMNWDTTLFTADVLYEYGDPVNEAYFDSQYFFIQNNGWDNYFHLTLTDHADLEYFWWGDSQHFPIFVLLERGPLGPWVNTKNIEFKQLSVYPNPSAGLVNLEFPTSVSGTLTIYDSKGKLVLSENVSTDRKQIDLHNAADGLYYAVYEGTGKRIVKKVVLRK